MLWSLRMNQNCESYRNPLAEGVHEEGQLGALTQGSGCLAQGDRLHLKDTGET